MRFFGYRRMHQKARLYGESVYLWLDSKKSLSGDCFKCIDRPLCHLTNDITMVGSTLLN